MKVIGFFLLLSLMGCQQKPTLGVTESGLLVQDQDYRKVILEKSVVFDTRSPFDFNISKVPRSINLPLSDFQASKDLLDAARRLSFYGVNPETSVVIIGDGLGDEQALAWEFMKLGVVQIETLKASVFRMMNVRPEGSQKNVSLWKPHSFFTELTKSEFEKKMNSIRPKPTSRAKAEINQGFPVAKALRESILIVTTAPADSLKNQFYYADFFQLKDQNLFDEKGLLNSTFLISQNNSFDIKKYDYVFLVDSSSRKKAHAYALVKFGAKSLFLVH